MAEVLYLPMEVTMADLIFIGVTLAFFISCFGLIRFFSSLERGK